MSWGSLGMTSEGLWEMFKGDFAETCSDKILLKLMGRRATPTSVRRRGARTAVHQHATSMASWSHACNRSFTLIAHIKGSQVCKRSWGFIVVLRILFGTIVLFCCKLVMIVYTGRAIFCQFYYIFIYLRYGFKIPQLR